MNAFQDLICRMKIGQQDLSTLHHYVKGGGGAWFPAHEKLGSLYDSLAAMTDDLIEIGISVGVQEPGIREAATAYQPTVKSVEVAPGAALQKARVILTGIADEMQDIGDQLDDDQRYIQSQMDSYIYTLRKEADYKLARAAE